MKSKILNYIFCSHFHAKCLFQGAKLIQRSSRSEHAPNAEHVKEEQKPIVFRP